jgi:hypothetical protein
MTPEDDIRALRDALRPPCTMTTILKACTPARIERLCVLAERYLWIESQRSLHLATNGARWTRPDGTLFVCSHLIAVDGRQLAPEESLDTAIDKARGAA